jgi:hypothetical protein
LSVERAQFKVQGACGAFKAASRRSKFKTPSACSRPRSGVQGAFGAFKVQGRCAALFVICYQLFGFPLFPITINC